MRGGGPGGPDLQSQDSVRFKGNARILRFIGPNLNKLYSGSSYRSLKVDPVGTTPKVQAPEHVSPEQTETVGNNLTDGGPVMHEGESETQKSP